MINNLKNWIVHGFWIVLVISLAWITYAAVTQVFPWDTLTADIFNESMVPTGAVMAFNGSTCPAGWTKADGSWDEKDTLWNLTTLDLRWEFIRGLDDGRGVDTWRTLATAQWDAIRNITGTFSMNSVTNVTVWSAVTNVSWAFEFNGSLNAIDDIDSNANNGSVYRSAAFDASNVVPTATENRPRNVALLYCVKN